MAAKRSRLGELHRAFTEMLIKELEIYTEGGGEDGEVLPMSASDKQVIVAFLKNNEVTADPDSAEVAALGDLFKEAREKERQRKAQELLATQGDPLEAMLLQ